MKVYLAGAYSRRRDIRKYRDDLEARGHTVTSRWIDQEIEDDDPAEHELAGYAANDLDDVEAAAVAVFFTDAPSTRGGMWVELGYALGLGTPCLVLGPHVNVFTRLLDRAEAWPAVIDWLESYR